VVSAIHSRVATELFLFWFLEQFERLGPFGSAQGRLRAAVERLEGTSVIVATWQAIKVNTIHNSHL
jgi:hypothetical protein